MQLHRVDKEDKIFKILYKKGKGCEGKVKDMNNTDWSGCIPRSASFSLFPFIFLLALFSFLLSFCSKSHFILLLTVFLLYPVQRNNPLKMSLRKIQSKIQVVLSPVKVKIHMNYFKNHHSSLSKSFSDVHMYSTLMARFKKKFIPQFVRFGLIIWAFFCYRSTVLPHIFDVEVRVFIVHSSVLNPKSEGFPPKKSTGVRDILRSMCYFWGAGWTNLWAIRLTGKYLMFFCGFVLFLTSKRQFPSPRINRKSISSHLLFAWLHMYLCISCSRRLGFA